MVSLRQASGKYCRCSTIFHEISIDEIVRARQCGYITVSHDTRKDILYRATYQLHSEGVRLPTRRGGMMCVVMDFSGTD